MHFATCAPMVIAVPHFGEIGADPSPSVLSESQSMLITHVPASVGARPNNKSQKATRRSFKKTLHDVRRQHLDALINVALANGEEPLWSHGNKLGSHDRGSQVARMP